MQRLTMDRDHDAWAYPAQHVLEFGLTRMAGDVHEMRAIGDHLDALIDQAIDHAADFLLVAGNGARGKDHAVAWRQYDFGVLVLGNARQGRPRLALAPGAQGHHLVRWQIAEDVHAAKILYAVKIAGLARHLHDALHGTADHDHLSVSSACGNGDGAKTGNAGGKGGNRDPPARSLDQFSEGFGDIGFRR